VLFRSLEDNSPLHWGHLFDCGDRRDGTEYRDMTDSNLPEVTAIKGRFNELLESLPAPVLADEGAPNQRKNAKKAKKGKAT